MLTVGVVAHFEAKPGTAVEMERFFMSGRAIVEQQAGTTIWFAYRLSPTSYGAFAAFATAGDRDTLLAAGGPKLSAEFAGLFAKPPSFELMDILEARTNL